MSNRIINTMTLALWVHSFKQDFIANRNRGRRSAIQYTAQIALVQSIPSTPQLSSFERAFI